MSVESAKHIPPNRHVLITGMTGTGKSFLAERYLTGYDYVVKLDTKGETDERLRAGLSAWEGLEIGKDFSIVRHIDLLDDCDTDKIIYVPSYDKQNEETFNLFFRWIFERENTIVWVDELMSLGTAMRYPKELGRIYQQGRSKNVAVWACSQRPSGIPLIVGANSSYFFVFDMALPQDRKRMVEVTGMPELMEMPNGYNFWFYKMGDHKAVKAVLVEESKMDFIFDFLVAIIILLAVLSFS